jgi:hypothetical protein
MAGSSVTITVDDAQVRAALKDLLEQLHTPARALRDVGEYLLRATDTRFRQQRGPDGTPWPQLSDITLLRRLAGTASHGGADGKPVGYLSAEALGDLAAKRGRMSKRKTTTGGRTLTKKGQKILAAVSTKPSCTTGASAVTTVGATSLALPTSAGNSSSLGRSSSARSPKYSRNCCVVPYTYGRPGTSLRPAILMSPLFSKCITTPSEFTPRSTSTSVRETGCL